ncbi:CrcB family protein [Streptomyces sp. NBC_01498]|uniref:fluoride efflux transporter FluC n=1 Tax=Streptomyces sp. NBC_01498 TaxID=2975870 RepID=UPI002E7C4B6A|nr:CrcB family protein [Streptomyces sp. NBC_01498]WTL25019.1 CrcB family protein [Streptomyces sp. NBC_01498]
MLLLLVVLGGAGGAALRVVVEKCVLRVWRGDLPPGVPFAVNFIGCFLLGAVLGATNSRIPPAVSYVLLGGAVTTFSVVSHQLLDLYRGGHHRMAGLRAATNWLIGSAAAVCGIVTVN